MKTIILSQFTAVLILIFTFHACNESGVTDNLGEKKDIGASEQFEQTLNQIFNLAGEQLQSVEGNSQDLDVILENAYLEVLQDEAMLDVYRASAEQAAQRHTKSDRQTASVAAITESDNPDEVLRRIEAMLEEEDLDESTVIELISLRQTILFLKENYSHLESGEATFDKSGIHVIEGSVGWWERWGRCAAGTVGGAGLGALTGCGVGALAAAGIGCSAGAVLGGVSGALSGASSAC